MNTYHIRGQLWTPIPISRSIQAGSEEEAKVKFLQNVALEFAYSEGYVRQHLYIHQAGGEK